MKTIFCFLTLYSSILYAQAPFVLRIEGGGNTELLNTINTALLQSTAVDLTEDIIKLLPIYGYYHARVAHTITDPRLYKITLGPPVLLGKISTQTVGFAYHTTLARQLFNTDPLMSGQIFNHIEYEKYKQRVLANAIRLGYLQAYYKTSEVLIDPQTNKASMHLAVDSGPLFTLGPVQFSNHYFSDYFLHRFLTYKVGEPYVAEKVFELEKSLTSSAYFTEVEVVPLIPEDHDVSVKKVRVPLMVTLKRHKKNQYFFGLGYDTNTGARLRLGWDRVYLNAWGHRLETNAKISQKDKNIQADYVIPGKHPLNDEYRISLAASDDSVKDKPSRLYSATVSETHKIKNWQRTLSARFLAERFNDVSAISESYHIILPSIEFVKIRSNGAFISVLGGDPLTNGYRYKVNVRGGLNTQAPHKSFVQAYMEYKHLKKIHPHTFILRMETGMTVVEELKDLPGSIRFFAGGDKSIRGFSYQSLPVAKGALVPVGGAYLAVASVEYNRLIKGPISFATFVDGGNAFNQLKDLKKDFQVGAGLGVRWATPIGPIKVDIATNLTNKAFKAWRVHINFGPEL